VAASTAFDMLSLMQGMIADSALTKSAKQVPNVEAPNVGTQVSAAYCAYKSGLDGGRFKECMSDFWTPVGVVTIIAAPDLPGKVWATIRLGFQSVVKALAFKVGVATVA